MRILLVLLLVLPSMVRAQSSPHSEVLIFAPSAEPDERLGLRAVAARLAAQGLGIDHARAESTDRGVALRVVLSQEELAAAKASGLELEVLVEDLSAHYLTTRSGTCEEGQGASRIDAELCGTMGGYLTFDAVVERLTALAAAHPNIVSAPQSLGESHEGRDVWMVEISDNPGVEENEGEVLYTAVHHAREPGGMAAVLYYMYYLVENYGSDDEVTNLVDNSRMFFVPVLNPDGYVYNETTNPDGGGFWRKNRRDDGGNVFGVDLNRNYGYLWGYDDFGSSDFPESEVYRGPEPFSEPETQAIRDFLESGRRVSHAFNYHTYSELLLYPWSYEDGFYTDDDDIFSELGAELTEFNDYTYGTSWEILYKVNGGSDDWMYGEEETKDKIFAFTPEVGYSFWPDPVDVYRLADDNLEANLRLAQAAVLQAVPNEPEVAPAAGDQLLAPYPNPFATQTRVTYSLRDAGPVRISIHDVLGREVGVLLDAVQPAGPGAIVLDGSDYANGLYVVRLETASQLLARFVTVVR